MRLALLAATFVLSLSGCVERLAPRGPEVTEPVLLGQAWRAADGAELPLRAWLPDAEPRAVVLALHGMNDYSNAFEEPGKALAARGLAVYAYDQRGFGRGPHPGQWSGAETMAADLNACADLLAARHPGRRLFVLGESMGGAVALVAVANQPSPAIAGLILSAPAVWGRSTMGPLQRGLLWLANAVVPGLTLTGRGLGIQASDNIEMLRALGRDPLVIKETRVDAIHGLVDLMDQAQQAAERVGLPLLVLYGDKDQVIPPAPTWAAIRRLPELGRSQRVALYADGWHMLLRDLQAAVVLGDIAAWVDNPGQSLPSGADSLAQGKLGQ
ncbi:alpha/beta hydrolase [Paramagnetospirillum marisnigri]|uniref:Alpha/beta hydrolase n=1 Tax=Paramagnetospirillum marisnigri TaxID=1285242 RepID=A0A178MSH5_9PROT|nr:alpha/beta hydrolase [Paramagnetospirillum marisnigri]